MWRRSHKGQAAVDAMAAWGVVVHALLEQKKNDAAPVNGRLLLVHGYTPTTTNNWQPARARGVMGFDEDENPNNAYVMTATH